MLTAPYGKVGRILTPLRFVFVVRLFNLRANCFPVLIIEVPQPREGASPVKPLTSIDWYNGSILIFLVFWTF